MMFVNILTNCLLNLSQFTIICIESGIDPNINEIFHSQKDYEFPLRLSSITIKLTRTKSRFCFKERRESTFRIIENGTTELHRVVTYLP